MITSFFRTITRGRKVIPDYARSQFVHLLAEYRTLQSHDDRTDDVVERVLKRNEENLLTWDDLFNFEIAVLRMKPIAQVRREAWSIRNRYREAAGEDEYAEYLKSSPPDPATADEEDLRADLDIVIGSLHKLYVVIPERERLRAILTASVSVLTVLGLIILVVFIWAYSKRNPSVPTLGVVLFAGGMGGFLSMQRRLQTATSRGGDPGLNLLELSYGWVSIFLSPITGAVFAVVLYLIFIAGLVKGTIFPTIQSPVASSDGLAFGTFATKTGPATGADFAILLVWSFIAGFAERFVPDTLDRLVSEASEKTTKS